MFPLLAGSDAIIWLTGVRLSPCAWLGNGHNFRLHVVLEVRPVYHFRPDRVRNHVRLCFLAYWLCARLGQQWRACGERTEVPRLLRRMQSIRGGTLRVASQAVRRLLTQIPAELNKVLERLGLLHLLGQPPPWAHM